MESPVKKLDLNPSDKENRPFDADAVIAAEETVLAPVDVVKKEEEKAVVAKNIKDLEAEEPLLQENPQRFVLFPIKYHEVREASRRVKCSSRPGCIHR